ncbi:6087_t:CDS:2 [Funneliformis caledonium]|uniref:6087_t:CDS:1 n=1 Tax=Funneliformis caledonium TaxID=1117310 RepID=A0A9N9BAW1_9GLOM|nr:6087_t:CDS:2 [Funneliformis caledonium]
MKIPENPIKQPLRKQSKRKSRENTDSKRDTSYSILALKSQQEFFEPVEQNTQYEFEETNNQGIN